MYKHTAYYTTRCIYFLSSFRLRKTHQYINLKKIRFINMILIFWYTHFSIQIKQKQKRVTIHPDRIISPTCNSIYWTFYWHHVSCLTNRPIPSRTKKSVTYNWCYIISYRSFEIVQFLIVWLQAWVNWKMLMKKNKCAVLIDILVINQYWEYHEYCKIG